LKELALIFLRLGTIAFGGPAAHIAMMEEEIVKRRKWISHEHFLDLLGMTNLIPGPNSTEMAIQIGYLRAGWKGLVVAGACFILPATIITLFLAHLYVAYGSIPRFLPLMAGIRPAIISIILAAVYRLGKPMLKKSFSVAIGIAVVAANLLGADEILLLLGSGIIGLLWKYRDRFQQSLAPLLLLIPPVASQAAIQQTAAGQTIVNLGLFFLKIGSILYGSGYVLVAFLQHGLVDARHWLTQSQLLDAIAVGQFTPGPVLSTSTFIGYIILGLPGAFVSTAGIFLPSFIFVLISGPLIPKLRRSPLLSGFLDGVNAGALGLMIGVSLKLAISILSGPLPWIIFLAALAAVVLWRVNAAWIVIGSAVLGWLVSLF
jgi:chromate transporter